MKKRSGVLILLGSLLLSAGANAAMPEKDYLAALKSAEKKVLRLKEQQSRDTSLSSGMIKLLFGRYYQPGDSWDIAAWQFDGAKLNHPPSLRLQSAPSFASQGIFHYEVTSVKSGTHPQIFLKVTQTESFGMKIVDPQVKALQLIMTDGISQSDKSYLITGTGEDKDRWVRVFPDSLHTKISLLELFPLDIPDISTADKKSEFKFPELPATVRSFYEKFSAPPELSQSSWFEQDDFFGRPIQILWQQGNPWPTYLKTSNGISILIRKGAV